MVQSLSLMHSAWATKKVSLLVGLNTAIVEGVTRLGGTRHIIPIKVLFYDEKNAPMFSFLLSQVIKVPYIIPNFGGSG